MLPPNATPFPSPGTQGTSGATGRTTGIEPGRTPIRLSVGVWGGVEAGTLPGVMGALGGAAAVTVGRQRIEAGFAIRPTSRATSPTKTTAGGEISLTTGRLATCRELLSGKVELSPCAGVELGDMVAKGFGVTDPTTAHQPWVAVTAGARLAVWLTPRFGATANLDASIPLLRQHFVLSGVGPVFAPASVTGRGTWGLELRF